MKLEEAIYSWYTTEKSSIFVNFLEKNFARFNTGNSFTTKYKILKTDLPQLFPKAIKSLSNIQYIYSYSVKYLKHANKDINVTFIGGSKDTLDLFVAVYRSILKTWLMILDKQVFKDTYKSLD